MHLYVWLLHMYISLPNLESLGHPTWLHLSSLSVGNLLLCIENTQGKPPPHPSQKMDHYLSQADRQTARPGAVLEYVNGERDLD